MPSSNWIAPLKAVWALELLYLTQEAAAETKITVAPATLQVPRGSSDAEVAVKVEGLPRESDALTAAPALKEPAGGAQAGKIQYMLMAHPLRQFLRHLREAFRTAPAGTSAGS